MTKIDKGLSLLVLGLPAPVILMLTLWWGSLLFFADALLFPLLPLGGFALGLILDVTLLRKVLFKLFQMPISVIIVLEIFYTIMVYGVFMGFPVFNAFVGIVVVYVAAKSGVMRREPISEARRKTGFMNLFSLGLLLFVCVCSALLALNEPTIGSQLTGMLGLPFEVTMWMVWTLIFIGGALLLLFECLVSRIIAERIFKNSYPPIAA